MELIIINNKIKTNLMILIILISQINSKIIILIIIKCKIIDQTNQGQIGSKILHRFNEYKKFKFTETILIINY